MIKFTGGHRMGQNSEGRGRARHVTLSAGPLYTQVRWEVKGQSSRSISNTRENGNEGFFWVRVWDSPPTLRGKKLSPAAAGAKALLQSHNQKGNGKYRDENKVARGRIHCLVLFHSVPLVAAFPKRTSGGSVPSRPRGEKGEG